MSKNPKQVDRAIAVVTIKGAATMSEKGRGIIADWLRQKADDLEAEGSKYSPTFYARYFVGKK